MQINAYAGGAQAPAHMFANIPNEMKEWRQWVCWSYRENEGSKPSKIPLDPKNGRPGSVTDATTWASFNEAVRAFEAGGCAGIGFVLTNDDPYCFIDLDPDGTEQTRTNHLAIYAATADTYAELSPSGEGLHIITKASVPAGRKRYQVEVYSSERFMTMTGVVDRERPIVEMGGYVDYVWSKLGAPKSAAASISDQPQTEDDMAVVHRMLGAQNGALAAELMYRGWEARYASQSEADAALLSIIAFWTKNRAQIARIFRTSVLGAREKAQRDNYLERSIDFALNDAIDTASLAGQVKRHLENAPPSFAPLGSIPTGFDDAVDFAGNEPPVRQWIVPNWIPDRDVTLISGDGGTGKSLVLAQLAACAAYQALWLGLLVTSPGRVMFVTAEDETDEIHRRVHTIARRMNVQMARGRFIARSLAGEDAILAERQRGTSSLKMTAQSEQLWVWCEEFRPKLLILENAADLYGGDENDRVQVRQFVSMLRTLALRLDMAIVFLSHPSLDGLKSGSGMSGSTAWNNSVRSRLYLRQDENEPNHRILEVKKANYGPRGQQIKLEFRDGTFIQLGVVGDANTHRFEAEASADELFVALLAEFWERGSHVSRAPQSVNYAPKLFARNPKANGITKHQFASAMDRLISCGKIIDTKVGKFASKQKEAIMVAPTSNLPSNSISG